MTDRELRLLRRGELIEIIYQYEKQAEKLAAENARLAAELEDRRVRIREAGSIAQAALSLSGVFEAADRAAVQYLEETQAMRAETEEQARQVLAEARRQAEEIVRRGEREAAELRRKSEDEYLAMRRQIWETLQTFENLREGGSPRKGDGP